MTMALEGSEGSASRPGRSLPHGKTREPIVQEAGWAPGPVWTGTENLASTGIWSPDHPARSQSLYRLSYPAHITTVVVSWKQWYQSIIPQVIIPKDHNIQHTSTAVKIPKLVTCLMSYKIIFCQKCGSCNLCVSWMTEECSSLNTNTSACLISFT
jgi:hypothetical protein